MSRNELERSLSVENKAVHSALRPAFAAPIPVLKSPPAVGSVPNRLSLAEASRPMGLSRDAVLWRQPQPVSVVSKTVCEELRRIVRLDKQAPPKHVASVRKAIEHYATNLEKRGEGSLSSATIDILSATYKASTIQSHGPYWDKWVSYCGVVQVDPLPVRVVVLANWLVDASAGDTSASPTVHRVSAVSFFSGLAGHSSPADDALIRLTKKALSQRLGFVHSEKYALFRKDLHLLYEKFGQPGCSLKGLLRVFQFALMCECGLRFDDLASVFFGSFVPTTEFVKVFLAGTKTDRYLEGQWVSFATSDEPASCFQLMRRSLAMLGFAWHCLSKDEQTVRGGVDGLVMIDKLPVLCVLQGDDSFPSLSSKPESYDSFSKEFKELLRQAGLDSEKYGTHSWRRGWATEANAVGVSDRLIKTMCRWKSDSMLGVYINDDRTLESLLEAVKAIGKPL